MATERVNERQKKVMFYKMKDYFKGIWRERLSAFGVFLLRLILMM